jgi:hypothetical protein
MGDVLWHLEYVLQLQQAHKQNVDSESFGSGELRFDDISFSLPHIREGEKEDHSKRSIIREEGGTRHLRFSVF